MAVMIDRVMEILLLGLQVLALAWLIFGVDW
jgi:hypothetical protein